MHFRDGEHEKLFRQMFATDEGQTTTELSELFIKSKSEYVRRTSQYLRAQRTKHAWRKFRFRFKKGIHRYHRNSGTAKIRKSFSEFLHKILKEGNLILNMSEDSNAVNGLVFTLPIYEDLDFIRHLGVLKNHLLHTLDEFELEENYSDLREWAESTITSMRAIESSVLFEGESFDLEHLEPIIALVETELNDLGEYFTDLSDDMSLVESFLHLDVEGNELNDTDNDETSDETSQ